MSDQIEVRVMKYGDRRAFIMYYIDPMTNKRHTRSTKTAVKKDADKAAAKWEAELREGRYKPLANIGWAEFRERYEAEVVPTMAKSTANVISTAFNSIERVLNPQRLRDATADRLSFYQSKLREAKLADASIRSYLATVKAAFAWAVDVGLLAAVPKVKNAKRVRGAKMMKGRPVTTEEFERMLDKIIEGIILAGDDRKSEPKETDGKRRKARSEAAKANDRNRQQASARAAAPSWRRLLMGLKLSGLRLGEALGLSWDDETKIMVDLTGKRPMLQILAELEKGGRDRMHPVTPDFAEFLWATPEAERTGPVFSIPGRWGGGCVGLQWASRVIGAIGKAARVVVDRDAGKFASAHDLRRSFGEKWSKLVMPIVLQQLMRHESIETTLRYYVGQNAESTADAVWEAAGRCNNSSNNRHSQQKSDESPSSQVEAQQRV